MFTKNSYECIISKAHHSAKKLNIAQKGMVKKYDNEGCKRNNQLDNGICCCNSVSPFNKQICYIPGKLTYRLYGKYLYDK